MVASTNFSMVRGRASGILSTRASGTQRLALLSLIRSWQVVTLFSVTTVIIATTADLNARDVSVALKARRTVADGWVEFNLTKSSITANGAQARINAVLVFASFGDWAVIVNQALVCKRNLCDDKSSQTYFFLSYYLLFGISVLWMWSLRLREDEHFLLQSPPKKPVCN